jgi:hypothetical protein
MQSAAFSSATPTAALWAAFADFAPSNCVIAPCPELAKAWLFGRCSRPLSPSLHLPPPRGLLSLIARRYAASLPLARSLQKPGCLGDAVDRFLLRHSLLLLCGLLLLIARRYAASLPLARSLQKPGCLGDAAGRFLLRHIYRYTYRYTYRQPVGLLSLIARHHTASLPLARSLQKPGCLGDAVGRFLLRYSYRRPVGCCPRLRAVTLRYRPFPRA